MWCFLSGIRAVSMSSKKFELKGDTLKASTSQSTTTIDWDLYVICQNLSFLLYNQKGNQLEKDTIHLLKT